MSNFDQREAAKFDQLAAQWWDPEGACKPLHDLNLPRVEFIAERVPLSGQTVLDVGCGGGLLSEALAARGARVTGIDLAEKVLAVARMHASASDLEIDYQAISAEDLALTHPGTFDVVCCLEALEHVPEPQALVEALASLLRPGGSVFLSTINRTPLAWAGAILAAEHLLGILPKGTHEYRRLIKPSELASACRLSGLEVISITGLAYNPFSRTVRFGSPPHINYFLHAVKTRT